jgi:ubiquinone/menaquinone biosynthesis C-methylase UbiE
LQLFYERPAIHELITRGDFGHASEVFEFGFGTGRLAEELLAHHLSKDSTYCGIDISTTMAEIADRRLRRWRSRVKLKVFDGTGKLEFQNQSFDRFISTYVFDLLSPDDICHVLSEAHRMLKPGGLLCNVSLTQGTNFFGKVITTAWKTVYSLNPKLVGGCRPIMLADYISSESWQIGYHNIFSTLGLASEVLIAKVRNV